jgi:superfamily I DNA/RNA helicase
VTQPWLDGVRGTEVLPLIEEDAPVIRVEAGPGAGKTFGLVRRVQRLVHPDGMNLRGGDILIVAFNRVIAQSLRKDIEKGLLQSGIEETPIIQTLHALCLRIVGNHLRILMDHERDAMIFDIRREHEQLRRDFESPAKTDQALRDHEARHIENAFLWSAVQQWLRRHRSSLISELPSLLLDRLDAGDFQTTRYAHVIVDEFQDLTEAEQRLMVTLLSPDGNVVALGDPRQSIYKFRGNDREGLSKLEVLSGKTVLDVPMTECQRCPDEVVSAANKLMVLYPVAPMTPTGTRGANLHVVTWNTPLMEVRGMAKAIRDNYLANPDERHLVMVTRRKFGFMLREELRLLAPDMAIDLDFSETLLETWAVREAFILFCLLIDPDAATWRAWFAYSNSETGEHFKASDRNAAAYLRFLTACGDEITWTNVADLSMESRTANRGAGGTTLWERVKRALTLRGEFEDPFAEPELWITAFFNAAHWVQAAMLDRDTALVDLDLAREKVLAIFASGREESPTTEVGIVLKQTVQTLRYQIATREPFESASEANVHVSTLWGAKGVTAEHVYILGLFKEAIPGTRRSEYPGTDDEFFEEQRRLFYVSITRSKKTMVLSRPIKINRNEAAKLSIEIADGRSPWPLLEASPFLIDILEFLPRAVDGAVWAGPATT